MPLSGRDNLTGLIRAAGPCVDKGKQPMICLPAGILLRLLHDCVFRGGWVAYRWLAAAAADADKFVQTVALQEFRTSVALLDGR